MHPRLEADGSIYLDLPIISTARYCEQHVIDAICAFATPQRGIPCEQGHPVLRENDSPIKRLNRIGQINLENACALIQRIRVIRPGTRDYPPILRGYVKPTGPFAVKITEDLLNGKSQMAMRALVSPERELLKVVTWDVVNAQYTLPV